MPKWVIDKKRFLRMLHWLVLGMFLYYLALSVPFPPQIQTGLLACANSNMATFFGYWIDHSLWKTFDTRLAEAPEKVSDASKAARLLSRALLISAMVIGANLKLA